jgi:hypothetical protein
MQQHGNDSAQATLVALLGDLETMATYLSERGRHTYDLAQRFLENARRDPSNRAFDERQAAMLEYQHYVWHEIAGMVNKLLITYSPGERNDASGDEQPHSPEGEC